MARGLRWLVLLACGLVLCKAGKKSKSAAEESKQYELPADLLTRVLWDEPVDQLERLSKISDAGDEVISRTFLSPAHRKAQINIAAWMRRAGMRVRYDNIGNVHGRIEGRNKKAPAILIGSHYDTVYDAGKFDGTLGIITGIAAVKATLIEAAVNAGMLDPDDANADGPAAYVNLEELLDSNVGRLLEAPVEVIAFSDEEGVRFQTTFLGSSAVAGTLVSAGGLNAVDKDGKTIMEVLEDHNYPGTPESVEDVAMRKDKVAEYVEMHIEQGPVLESLDKPLGLVDGIAGQVRLFVAMHGQQGHAGTVPMKLRSDPMAGAAEAIHDIELACVGTNPGVTIDDSLVCTVGMLQLWPGASNVIPGSVNFTLDMRSRSDDVRRSLTKYAEQHVQQICKTRGLSCDVQIRHEAATVHCDKGVMKGLRGAIARAGEVAEGMQRYKACQAAGSSRAVCSEEVKIHLSNRRGETGICSAASGEEKGDSDGAQGSCSAAAPVDGVAAAAAADDDEGAEDQGDGVPTLVSGAGHDAMAMATLTKIGMVFVRCVGGISHSPQEQVNPSDIGTATAALFQYLRTRVGGQPAGAA